MNKKNFLTFLMLVVPFGLMSAKTDSKSLMDTTDVLTDLCKDPSFLIDNYPAVLSSKEMSIINFAEMGFSDITKEYYFGYLYLYNPGLQFFDLNNSNNSIGLQFKSDDTFTVKKIELKLISTSSDARFLKFKLNPEAFTFQYYNQANSNVELGYRSYSFTYLNLFSKTESKLKSYNVAKEFRYKGKGQGIDGNVYSTIEVSLKSVETVNLDAVHDVYLSETYSSVGTGHRNELFYCTFQIPNSLSSKGDLVSLDMNCYEMRTKDLYVFKDQDVLNKFKAVCTSPIPPKDSLRYFKRRNSDRGEEEINLRNFPKLTYDEISSFMFYDTSLNVPDDTLLDLIVKTGRNNSYLLNKIDGVNYFKTCSFNNKMKFDMLSYEDVYKGNGWQYFWDGLLGHPQDDGARDLDVLKKLNVSDIYSSAKDLKITDDTKNLISNQVIDPLKSTFLLRYRLSDYESFDFLEQHKNAPCPSQNKNAYIANTTVILDAQIITLTFNKDGIISKISVVDQPKDSVGSLIPPLSFTNSWQWILIIIISIIAFIILIPIFPGLLNMIVSIIMLPVTIIKKLFK